MNDERLDRDVPNAAARSHEQRETRADRNRSAWPVGMHVEKGELKEDKAIGQE